MNILELNQYMVSLEKKFGSAKPAMTHSDLGQQRNPTARAGGGSRQFRESDHPRDADGKFGSGGGAPKQPTTLEGPNALYMSVGRGANGDTRKAKAASQKADDTNSKADHSAAATAHDIAAKSHKKAFTLAGQSKLPEAAKIHMSLEKYHIDLFKYHKARS